MPLTYKCSECGEPLESHGEDGGLGTWTCPRHPSRSVTVIQDLSGGKENDRGSRKVPVTVRRHTLVVKRRVP